MIYALIFIAKLLEVAITTVRVVLTARGNRLISGLLAAVEISLWIVVASKVLLGINDDPFQAVVYGAAYAIGIYIGIAIEDKLALGLAQIEVITGPEEAKLITDKLRGSGYGVTSFPCEGLEGPKQSIVMKVHRKDIPATIKLIKEHEQLFVTITDIRKLSMGIINRHMFQRN
jgi:uncharacterized protein YebE (UPF0316 family)